MAVEPAPAAARPSALAIAAIVAVGWGLRLTALDVHSLWYDEAGSIHVASSANLTEALAQDRHPPLYFWLLARWMELCGDSETRLRLLSALTSSLALALFALVARVALSARAAWIAIALLALSPYSVWYAQEARAYALCELAGVLGLCAVMLALRDRPSTALAALLAFAASAIACGAHYIAVLLAPTLVLAALLGALSGWMRRRAAASLAAAAIAGALCWVPWIARMLPLQSATVWGYSAHLSLRDFAEFPARLFLVEAHVLVGPQHLLGYAVGVAIAVGLALAAVSAVRKRDALAASALVLFTGPVLAALVRGLFAPPTFLPRYFAVCEPAFVAAVALGLATIRARLVRLVLVGVLLATAVLTVALHRRENLKEDYRSAVERVAMNWRPGDVVVGITSTPAGFSEAGVRYYLRELPEISHAIVPEGELMVRVGALPAGTRVHVVFRLAPYSEQGLRRLVDRADVLEEGPMELRLQYFLLRMRGG